jgi:hypothetical protein
MSDFENYDDERISKGYDAIRKARSDPRRRSHWYDEATCQLGNVRYVSPEPASPPASARAADALDAVMSAAGVEVKVEVLCAVDWDKTRRSLEEIAVDPSLSTSERERGLARCELDFLDQVKDYLRERCAESLRRNVTVSPLRAFSHDPEQRFRALMLLTVHVERRWWSLLERLA